MLCGTGCRGAGPCAACIADLAPTVSPPNPADLPFVDRVEVPFAYRFPLDRLIRAAKFHRDLAAMAACTALLCLKVCAHFNNIDRVLPVPLGRRRYRTRGFNQSGILAAALAVRGGWTVDHDLLVRREDRAAQSTLPPRARRANVAGAFGMRRACPAGTVLVVDDVITTGATVVEIARTLRAGGATRVYVAALASSPAAKQAV